MQYKRFMNDVFGIWAGPMEIHDELLELLDNKSDRIKLMRVIRENSISFLGLFLYKDNFPSTYTLQAYFPTCKKFLLLLEETPRVIKQASTMDG